MEVEGPPMGISNENIMRVRSKCTWYKKGLIKSIRSSTAEKHASMQDDILEPKDVKKFHELVRRDAEGSTHWEKENIATSMLSMYKITLS